MLTKFGLHPLDSLGLRALQLTELQACVGLSLAADLHGSAAHESSAIRMSNASASRLHVTTGKWRFWTKLKCSMSMLNANLNANAAYQLHAQAKSLQPSVTHLH